MFGGGVFSPKAFFQFSLTALTLLVELLFANFAGVGVVVVIRFDFGIGPLSALFTDNDFIGNDVPFSYNTVSYEEVEFVNRRLNVVDRVRIVVCLDKLHGRVGAGHHVDEEVLG